MEPYYYKVVELKLPKSVPLSKNVNFNPSIAHIVDDLFLISFYTWRRKNRPVPSTHQLEGSIKDPYHQYYGGRNSSTWWRPDKFWGTGFIVAKINNRAIRPIFDAGYNNDCYDMKLAATASGVYGTSNCGNIKIYIHNISFEFDEDTSIIQVHGMHDKGIKLCKEYQEEEKNWSIYTFNDKLYISQWLVPYHTVFEKTKNGCIQHSSYDFTGNFTLFYHIEKFYKKQVLFSLSTPAIPYDNLRMAVGHVKIMGDKVPKNTVAYDFVQNDLLKQPVDNTSYLMFIYVFNPTTLDIIKVSPGFYPPEMTHGVVFASGLTQHEEDYIISYGEGDAKMKFLFLNHYAIDRLLAPVHYYDKQYDFIYL